MNATDRVIGGSSPVRRRTLRQPRGLARWACVLLLLAGGGAACFAQATPGKEVVADVIPQGNRNVPTQKIMSVIKTRPGSNYNKDTVEEDVKALYKLGAFANVRTAEQRTPQGVVVYFLFQELPSLVQDIVYEGAKHLKPDELDSVTGLRKGVPLNPILNRMAREAIIRKYNDEGRPLASVELVEGDKPGDTRVVFRITEGPVCRISSIEVTGASFVSEARLKTQLNSGTMFLGLPLGGKYNRLMVEEDINKLIEYYRGFGYHDVSVSLESQWVDAGKVKLIFHVHEGQRYRVASVDVSGGRTLTRDEALVLTKLQADEIYSQSDVDHDKKLIQAAIGYRGIDATVREHLVYGDSGQVKVSYEVEEQPPARVGQIFVVGNSVTRQNVILRQVPLYPGQILPYPNLKIAENNLARLNIFEVKPEEGIRPTVSVLPGDPNDPYKDVMVNVQETQTGSLLFGVGVNSDAGLTGSIVLNERNFDILNPPRSFDDLLSGRAFRGAGQEFRIEAVPGTQLQRYTVSWREPFLFDTPYSLGVSGYYYDRVFNEYTESRLGTRITVGRQLNRYWSASGSVRIENVGVHDVAFWAPQDFQRVIGDNFLAGFRAAVTRDDRDSFLRPTEGSLVDISFEEVTGAYTFPVFNVEGNKYWTIWQRPDGSGRHVLAARTQMSIEGANAPVYERFYAGGFRTMRGFEFRGVGPDVNGFKVGGNFMWLNSLEYQIPIKANDQFYLVAFVDSGTVERRVEINDYRVAAGVGARIVVPMLGPVPIALDFGFPIVDAPTDNKQIFSFWVGFFH